MVKAELGIIGLGTMGSNLASNLLNKGISVSGYDIDEQKVQNFLKQNPEGFASIKLEEFVKTLNAPHVFLLLVPAGEAVDQILEQLEAYFDTGDYIFDGGNSYFKDTERRWVKLKRLGVEFFGMGVSGGAEGALNGPSMMVGGEKEPWEKKKWIFEAIAARYENTACVARVGNSSAGHLVKMIHNGIEYALMQLISELFVILQGGLGMSNDSIAEQIDIWNKKKIINNTAPNLYLLDITSRILRQRDENGILVLPKIDTITGQKGTGKWSVITALDQGIDVSTMASAVFQRFISGEPSLRSRYIKSVSSENKNSDRTAPDYLIEDIFQGFFISVLVAFNQGFNVLNKMKDDYFLDIVKTTEVWRAGCIIRTDLLNLIVEAWKGEETEILLSSNFKGYISNGLNALRRVLQYSISMKLPTPTLLNTLSYLDSMLYPELPTNLIQAQRDYFGQHGIRLKDNPEIKFHYNWKQD